MILVDTSVWIDHFRAGQPQLVRFLERNEVLMHPFVVGELACGNLKHRDGIIRLLRSLPRSAVATDDEVLAFIEIRRLMGRGIGYVDAHLLAAVALEGATLFTGDKRLGQVAEALGFAYRPPRSG